MIVDGRKFDSNQIIEADVVIIGSGAGGAPAAYRLAKAGKKVVVVEEGGNFAKDFFNSSTPYERMKYMYRNSGAVVSLGNAGVVIPLGKTLGGTTTVNSGTMFKTPDEVINLWRNNYNLTEISNEELLPYFNEVEELTDTTDVTWDLMGINNQLFAEGAKKLGYHGFPLRRNMKDCQGGGLCAFGCPHDAKRSMNVSYIPLSEKYGAVYYTYSHVENITTKSGKAVGVIGYFYNGRFGQENSGIKFEVKANVVILAAGSIYTPIILKKNKLANSSGLVGKNLRIHPAAKVMGYFEESMENWKGIPQAYCVDEFADEGIIFEGFWIPPSMLSIAIPKFGHELKTMMKDYTHLAGFGIMVHDTSSGNVNQFKGNPLIKYNLNNDDVNRFKKAVAIASEIYFEAGAKHIYPPVFGFEEFKSQKDIDHFLKSKVKADFFELSAFHPMGTAKMGANPKEGVIDQNLETFDIDSLFIMDASIFPTSLGVNPQESIMAFVSRAVDKMLSREEKYFN